ncbi:MAG: hypothetical protein KGL39_38845 [Patescibacteria group bacterium]|nr:hypothetical protein [Patescibacteria group bacterium]
MGFKHEDSYTRFLKVTWRCAEKWNSNKGADDISKFAWSTWEGCGEDEDLAYVALSDSIEECGLSPVDNQDYYGFVGGRWCTIIVLLERSGMERPLGGWRVWIRKHPYETNKLLVTQLCLLIQENGTETGLRIWQHGHDWLNDENLKSETDHYIHKVKVIRGQVEKYRETGN